MSIEVEAKPSKSMIWAGRVLSALPVVLLLGSAMMKLTHNPAAVAGLVGKYGYTEGAIAVIGTVELLCTAIYLVPMTSILGAILLTGYLGGAVSTHVRAGEPFFMPVLVGVMLWGGLFFRDERMRALIPLKRG